MKFSIIGFGRFGQCWVKALLPFGEVMVYDISPHIIVKNTSIKKVNIEEAAQADIIFLLVPISTFEQCCLQIKNFLNPNSLLVDCCSVKMYPVEIMQKIFPKTQAIAATHPLFGPDSVNKTGGFTSHKIVLCAIKSQMQSSLEDYLKELFEKIGLTVLTSTPEEHDRQMANSQSLVHFIGRGLTALNLSAQTISTPDFQALLNINHMVIHDTWQLFFDMQRYNPYAKEMRYKLIESLIQQDNAIENISENSENISNDLHRRRKEIESIDANIIHFLAMRQKLSREIGKLKARAGSPVKVPAREKELMCYYENLSTHYGLAFDFIKPLFEMIISYSRKQQE